MDYYLRKYPDPVLRQKAKPVLELDDDIAIIEENMRRILKEEGGVGLAAPQVGVSKRLLLVRMDPLSKDDKEDVRLFINPEITEADGEKVIEEGCLSVTGISAEVKRFGSIRLQAKNTEWDVLELSATDLLAVVFQHEIDHLDGILFVDRLSPAKKVLLSAKLKKLKKEWKS